MSSSLLSLSQSPTRHSSTAAISLPASSPFAFGRALSPYSLPAAVAFSWRARSVGSGGRWCPRCQKVGCGVGLTSQYGQTFNRFYNNFPTNYRKTTESGQSRKIDLRTQQPPATQTPSVRVGRWSGCVMWKEKVWLYVGAELFEGVVIGVFVVWGY